MVEVVVVVSSGRIAALERQQRDNAEEHLGGLEHELYAPQDVLQPEGAPLPQQEVQDADGGRHGEDERQDDAHGLVGGVVAARQERAEHLDQAQEHEHGHVRAQLVARETVLIGVVDRLGAYHRELEHGEHAEVIRIEVHEHFEHERRLHIASRVNNNNKNDV